MPSLSSQTLERALLSSSLIYPEVSSLTVQSLTADDFTVAPHRALWSVILETFSVHGVVDVTLVADSLYRRGWLTRVGGPAWLGELINEAPPTITERGIKRQIVQLRELSRKRHMSRKTRQGLAALETGASPEDVASMVLDAAVQHEPGDPVEASLKGLREGEHVMATGFSVLDHYIGGLGRGQLLVVGGYPGHGKTTLCLAIANDLASRDLAVAYFAQELPPDLMTTKLACLRANVSFRRIRWNLASPGERDRVIQEVERMRDTGFPVSFPSAERATGARVAAEVARIRLQRGTDAVVPIVDHLQRMAVSRPELVRIETAEYVRALKGLATREQVPVIAVSHLRRQPPSERPRRPRLNDLAESGAIEQEADTVIAVWQEPTAQSPRLAIFIEKRREGGPVERPIRLGLNPETGRVFDLPEQGWI